jgi:hypothetical protein
MNLQIRIKDKKGKEAIIKRQTTKMVKGKEVQTLKDEPMTIKTVLETCLLNKMEDVNPKSHVRRYDLWKKIKNVDVIYFSWREKRLIKKLVSETMDILVSAQIISNL